MENFILLTFLLFWGIADVVANEANEEIQEDVVFYLSFDGSIEADRSTGAGKAINFEKIKNPVFTDGISGKALVAKDKRIAMIFKRKDILNFSEAGSISMWIKPVKWLNSEDMPVVKKTGFRKTLYQNLFLTNYSKNGYLGFERITSPHPKHNARMLLFFAKFKGIKAGYSTRIDWSRQKSKWHNVVITWSPLCFKVYFDGEFKGETTLQQKIKDNDLSSTFNVECPAGTIMDEFIIYNKALSKEQVVKFYKALNKDGK